jgi:hypothetical protein
MTGTSPGQPSEPEAGEVPLLPAGRYWCNVVSYHDHSGVLAAYGPYRSETDAIRAGARLRGAGVHLHEAWDVKPLHLLISWGAAEGEAGHG